MYIFANWKMYLDYDESCILSNQLLTNPVADNVDVVVFPNMLALSEVEKIMRETPYSVGGQNCSWVPKGAYTGAVSALLLKETGCTHVLVGHSERRYIFGESDEDVRKKLDAALGAGLIPVLCIGETQEDRDVGKTEYRIKKQLMKALDGIEINGGKLVIAYEPVWAISRSGTGVSCDPQEAEKVHSMIKTEIKQYVDKEIPVIYGGSVNSQNVVSYASQNAIDGVLVGHASTQYEDFVLLLEHVSNL